MKGLKFLVLIGSCASLCVCASSFANPVAQVALCRASLATVGSKSTDFRFPVVIKPKDPASPERLSGFGKALVRKDLGMRVEVSSFKKQAGGKRTIYLQADAFQIGSKGKLRSLGYGTSTELDFSSAAECSGFPVKEGYACGHVLIINNDLVSMLMNLDPSVLPHSSLYTNRLYEEGKLPATFPYSFAMTCLVPQK